MRHPWASQPHTHPRAMFFSFPTSPCQPEARPLVAVPDAASASRTSLGSVPGETIRKRHFYVSVYTQGAAEQPRQTAERQQDPGNSGQDLHLLVHGLGGRAV